MNQGIYFIYNKPVATDGGPMSREVPYEQQTLNHPNPIARLAHEARYRNSLRVVGGSSPRGANVLDFGAGQGEFLHRLGAIRPDVHLLAYEPYMKLKYAEIRCYPSMEEIKDRSIDVLCAFETLEHISEQELDRFIAQAKRVCRPEGIIVVSVPIMQGMVLPIKEACKSILFHRFSDYSLVELARGVFGMRVSRAADILLSHKGFDRRILSGRLNSEFAVLESFHSPFRVLPWWCNSQAFLVLTSHAK